MPYDRLRRRALASRTAGAMRSSLRNPAAGLLALFRRHARTAVVDVACNTLEDLQIIYGYVVDPAFRSGGTLLIGADRTLAELAVRAGAGDLSDPDWRYPWTLERLLHVAARARPPAPIDAPPAVTPWRRLWRRLWRRGDVRDETATGPRLDPEQRAAVSAGDGVVQVIAPAGSGKTTVLIERVKELQRRGTPPARILCMSFNRDAKLEIGQRLARAGVEDAVVRSFHGMGLAILNAEGRLRARIGGLDDEALEALIGAVVADEAATEDIAFDVADARNAISDFKLAKMIPPAEAVRRAETGRPCERLAAQVFTRYQSELVRRDMLDFDDLVADAVTLLQSDVAARRRWQDRFERVLVDEYQDIEPSQALLVGLLAAPQDSLFCVGDEDQCIYAWRRATVQRIIELDQVYPGLERHALIRNYRCGRRITRASRRLIEHNRVRFRKPLRAGARQSGEIVVAACPDRRAAADLVAHLISDATPDGAVVLARTSRLLAEVAGACARRPSGRPSVELATIHAAKGREWERVILYGADEGQTPHRQAAADGGIEDERRLFYVALTRARQRLEIICTEGRESRFLREAGLG